jgi:hypothetical protein
MSWLDLSVSLTQGAKRMEKLLQQLKLKQQERESLDRNIRDPRLEAIFPPEGSIVNQRRRRIEPIASRLTEDADSAGIALGWLYRALPSTVNTPEPQLYSGDRSKVVNLNWLDFFGQFTPGDFNAFDHMMVLPIDKDRMMFVHSFFVGKINREPGASLGSTPSLVPPYVFETRCVLIGGDNVKEIDNVPQAFKQALRCVWTDPAVLGTIDGSNFFTNSPSEGDTHPNPSLGFTHFPTDPLNGYGFSDSLRRFFSSPGNLNFVGETFTIDSDFAYANNRFAEPTTLNFGTGSPANYSLIDLADGDPHNPDNYRPWWRMFWDDIFNIPGYLSFSADAPQYPLSPTHEQLRSFIPNASKVPIFSFDYTNPVYSPRKRVVSGKPAGSIPDNHWWVDMPVGAELTFRKWEGGTPTGSVSESFVPMTETSVAPAVGAQWGPPIVYQYSLKEQAEVLRPGPTPIRPLFSSTVEWPSRTVNLVTWSNGAEWHTTSSQANLEADGYTDILFLTARQPIVVKFRTTDQVEGVTILSFTQYQFPFGGDGPIIVQYYYLTNGSFYACPSTKEPADVFVSGNISGCTLLSGPGGGTEPGAILGFPEPLIAVDWGRTQDNINWLLGKGFSLEDLSFPEEDP